VKFEIIGRISLSTNAGVCYFAVIFQKKTKMFMFDKFAKKFSTVRMQLVFSVFVVIAPALIITYIVNQDWFWKFAPEWLKPYATDVPWMSFIIGLLALISAWFGGEHFILRQVRALSDAAMSSISRRAATSVAPGARRPTTQ